MLIVPCTKPFSLQLLKKLYVLVPSLLSNSDSILTQLHVDMGLDLVG